MTAPQDLHLCGVAELLNLPYEEVKKRYDVGDDEVRVLHSFVKHYVNFGLHLGLLRKKVRL
jgi:hypothetical protein